MNFRVGLVGFIGFFLTSCGRGPQQILPDTHNGFGGSGSLVTYNKQILPLFQKKCSLCHNSGSAIPNWLDYKVAFQNKDKILQRVFRDKTMPMAPMTMTDDERKMVAAWIESGAPEDEPSGSNPNPNPNPNPSPDPNPGATPTPLPPMSDANRHRLITCAGCHETDGNSINPIFPRLAGQMPLYLESQLKAFRDHTRADPHAQAYMWGMAKNLNDVDVSQFANYFAFQKPGTPDSTEDPALALQGKGYFENGIHDKQIPACISCHGSSAQGTGIFPRLAGQHSDYLMRQLGYFRDGLRAEGSTMPGVARSLSDEEIKAIAVYLQSLTGQGGGPN